MNDLRLLCKINLLTFFDLSKIKNSKNKKELLKALSKVFIVLLGLFIFSYYVYDISNSSVNGYIYLGIPHILLVQYFVISSVAGIFTNTLRINGILFNFKDYDLLMSMPIKRGIIVLSKIFVLYLTNLITTLLFMIPSYIVYINNVSVDVMFHFMFFISLLLIPLIPIIVSTIIGSLLTAISSLFKRKNLVNIILTFVLFAFIMYISYGLENASSIDMANIGKSIVNLFNNIYPLTRLYNNIIINNDITSLILFLVIPIFLFYIFILFINKFYGKINNNLNMVHTKSSYKFRDNDVNIPIVALYKKEIKRYFSSVNYILNTAIGVILLTISTFVLVFVGKDIDTLIGIDGLSNMFINFSPLVIGAFCVLSCTTNSSISLEGNHLWILKSLPVSEKEIFLSKILVNLTILIPFIIINSIVLAIYLHVSILTFIFMIITPLMYAIFTSLIGIIINLCFPLLNWKYEVRVIKQSMASIVSLFIGMIVALVPFNIEHNLTNNMFLFIITFTLLIVNAILYFILNSYGVKRFRRL